MPRVVSVTAPSRLHFGMFSFGENALRQFGGVGAMVDLPGMRLSMEMADGWEARGPLSQRTLDFVRRVATGLRLPKQSGCRVTVEAAPREHVGLGTGTQLGLAVAAGMHILFDRTIPFPSELALMMGRGDRSAIGTNGFAMGGLLVEAGKRSAGKKSPLVARAELPADWRFLLLVPRTATGLHGDAERQAFAGLPAVPPEITATLAREALLELLPAAMEADFEAFSRSLFRFGHTAGMCFAAKQQGAFADQRTAQWVERLRGLGVEGVGQSSWGPTVFALLPDEDRAKAIAAQLAAEAESADYQCIIAAPANAGARIEMSDAASA